jgi:hypothetical protein
MVGGVFSRRIIWTWAFRALIFTGAFFVVAGLVYRSHGQMPVAAVLNVLAQASRGDPSSFTKQAFAVSLAWLLGAAAFGFAAAYLVCHVLLTSLSLREARRLVSACPNPLAFSEKFDDISMALEAHPLIGHAWTGFSRTCLPNKRVVRNTVRPNAYFNLTGLRERLPGLKVMQAIPGYFVGLGLLLTFIGLVLALSKAAEGTTQAQLAAGAGSAAMQGALRELLHAATFKFSTSIAGLAASIALSFIFKLYNIGVESALSQFCETLEKRLSYLAPQEVSTQIQTTLDGQLAELKAITGGEFFARLGQEIGPPLQTALQPLIEELQNAVGDLKANSQSGLSDMLQGFLEKLQGGAGTELRELTQTLKAMQDALEQQRQGLLGSGADFSLRMSQAAADLSGLVRTAGENLDDASARNRDALEKILTKLTATFGALNETVGRNVAESAAGASGLIEETMSRVLDKLEAQIGALQGALNGFQQNAARAVSDTQGRVGSAQEEGVKRIAEASAQAAEALKSGLGDTLAQIRREVERLSASLDASTLSLGEQRRAMETVASRSREAASAFAESASALRSAAEPVARSNEKLAGATQMMTDTLGRSLDALSKSREALAQVSDSLTEQNARISDTWRDYRKHFDGVDNALSSAFERMSSKTAEQAELLAKYTVEVDRGLAASIDRLAAFLQGLEQGSEGLQEAVDDLRETLAKAVKEAAE